MPLFLIPFIILAAGNTRMHKNQADAALMDAQTRRAEVVTMMMNVVTMASMVTLNSTPAQSTCATLHAGAGTHLLLPLPTKSETPLTFSPLRIRNKSQAASRLLRNPRTPSLGSAFPVFS